jgi:thiamine kinase-like enzyme
MAVITDVTQLTSTRLTGLLRDKGCLTKGSVKNIQTVKTTKTNGSTAYHLEIDYSGEEALAPRRLFLKISRPDLAWSHKEVEFYNVIAPVILDAHPPETDLPFLHCYDAVYAADIGRSHLLLEELSVTHFATSDSMPPTLQHGEQVIDAYALFHAAWWEHPRLGQDIGELLTEQAIDAFLSQAQKKFREVVDFRGEGLSGAQRQPLEQVVSAWPINRRRRLVQGQGITLVHRDPHPRNFLYPRDIQAGRVKLIDWQSWRVDAGTDDLAYLLACHWPIQQRKQVERGLLKRYHERLVMLGVQAYTWDHCRYDYRASIIRCLFFLMYAWSPAHWQTGTWWSRVEKGLEAFDDWDCGALLRH